MRTLASAAAALFAGGVLFAGSALPAAALDLPFEGAVSIDTPHGFDTLWDRMEQAVEDNEMGLVGRASGSRFAEARGVEIPGNGVIDVFRNDFAVRLLTADVAAGFEAPIRFYLTENEDGTATLTYRTPSSLFAPYGDDPEVLAIGAELDEIFAAIAAQATAAE